MFSHCDITNSHRHGGNQIMTCLYCHLGHSGDRHFMTPLYSQRKIGFSVASQGAYKITLLGTF